MADMTPWTAVKLAKRLLLVGRRACVKLTVALRPRLSIQGRIGEGGEGLDLSRTRLVGSGARGDPASSAVAWTIMCVSWSGATAQSGVEDADFCSASFRACTET